MVPRTAIATLYRRQRAYLKQGFYRAPSDRVSRLFLSPVTASPVPAKRRR